MQASASTTGVTEPATSGDGSATTGTRVTVRYWAAARAAAGRVDDQVSATTVAEALEKVRAAHGHNPRFGQVLSISSLLLGDRPIATSDLHAVSLAPGDVVEVLPPFAGGSGGSIEAKADDHRYPGASAPVYVGHRYRRPDQDRVA